MQSVWKVKQVIPVAGTDTSYLCHTRIESLDQEFLSYSSGNIAVILSSDLEVVQIIESFADISNLSWSESDGQLAVCVDKCLEIYQHFREPGTNRHVWEKKCRIEEDFVIQDVTWTPDGHYILVGGSSLVLWDLYPGRTLSEITADKTKERPKPIKHTTIPLSTESVAKIVQISPDGRFFVTVSDNDRTPKVWYKRKNGYAYFYLPHPRAVLSVSWRKQYMDTADWRNVILTTCRDGEARIWVESGHSEKLQFTLLHAIHTGTETVVDWLSGFFAKGNHPTFDLTKEKRSFHAISTNLASKDRHTTQMTKYHYHSYFPRQDWILGIDPDGSITIWRITDLPYHQSKIKKHVYLRQAFAHTRRNSLVAVAKRFSVKDNELFYPSLICVYVSSVLGDITSWNVHMGASSGSSNGTSSGHSNNIMNYLEISSSMESNPDSRLSGRSFGHRHKIKQLIRHPRLPVLASLDVAGLVIVWLISDTSLSDTVHVLSDLCSVTSHYKGQHDGSSTGSPHPTTAITWDSHTAVLYTLHPSSGIEAFFIPYNFNDHIDPASSTQHSFSPPSQSSSPSVSPLLSHHSTTTKTRLKVIESSLTVFPQKIQVNFTSDAIVDWNSLKHFTTLPPFYFDLQLGSHDSTPVEKSLTTNQFSPTPNSSPATALFGLDNSGKIFHVWGVSLSSTKDQLTLNFQLLITKNLRASSAALGITCYTLPRALTRDDGLGSLQNHCSLITGGQDGFMRAWRLLRQTRGISDTGSSFSWDFVELCAAPAFPKSSTQSEFTPITSIAASSLGRIATFGAVQTEDSKDKLKATYTDAIHIWEFESSGPDFRLEGCIEFTSQVDEDARNRLDAIGLASPLLSMSSPTTKPTSQIPSILSTLLPSISSSGSSTPKYPSTNTPLSQSSASSSSPSSSLSSIRLQKGALSMDWIVLTEGQELLVVSRGRFVSVFTQHPTANNALHQFDTHWTEVQTNSVPLPFLANQVIWTQHGNVVVSTEHHIHVFTKWIDTPNITSGTSSSIVNPEIPNTSIQPYTIFLTGIARSHTLPFYHPRILVECIMAGMFDRVGLILKHLHTQLEHHDRIHNINLDDQDKARKKHKKKKKRTQNKKVKDANTPFIVPLPLRTVLFQFGKLDESELLDTIQQQQEKQSQEDEKTNEPADSSAGDKEDNNISNNKDGDKDKEDSKSGDDDDKEEKEESSEDYAPLPLFIQPKSNPPSTSKNTDQFDFLQQEINEEDDEIKVSFSESESDSDSDSDSSDSSSNDNSDSEEKKKKKKKKKNKKKANKNKAEEKSEKRDDAPKPDNPLEENKILSEDEKFTASTSLFGNYNPSNPNSINKSITYEVINLEECKNLSEMLQRWPLRGVSPKEQAYLLAVLDTLSQVLREGKGFVDKCAVRYILMMRVFKYVRASLPPVQRNSYHMSWLEMAWALHSESHPNLIRQILPVDGKTEGSESECMWPNIRALGIALWMCDHATLVTLVDRIAKAHYLVKKDPHDCTLFYVASGRIAALAGLFQIAKEDKTSAFLKNDFTVQKIKSAALTNAYKLMGQHRFEMAAAFFLLADALQNAVSVCIDKLDDFQLALLVARLVEGGQTGPVFNKILTDHVLASSLAKGEQELASIALWLVGQYKESVEALVPEVNDTTTFVDESASPAPSLASSTAAVRSTPSTSSVQISISNPIHFKPGTLYLFDYLTKSRFIQNRNLVFDHLEPFLLRKSIYTYCHAGCNSLAFEQKLLYFMKFKDSKARGIGRDGSHGSSVDALVLEIEQELIQRSGLQFLSDHVTDMQFRALTLGARAVVAGAINRAHTDDAFQILEDDWALLETFLPSTLFLPQKQQKQLASAPSRSQTPTYATHLTPLLPPTQSPPPSPSHTQKLLPDNSLLQGVLSMCESNGYLREHYLILINRNLHQEAVDLLVRTARRIASVALRVLSTNHFEDTSPNILATTQARQLEVQSRHLYGCLIEYTNPGTNERNARVNEDEEEEEEEEEGEGNGENKVQVGASASSTTANSTTTNTATSSTSVTASTTTNITISMTTTTTTTIAAAATTSTPSHTATLPTTSTLATISTEVLTNTTVLTASSTQWTRASISSNRKREILLHTKDSEYFLGDGTAVKPPDMATVSQFLVIASGRVGVFAAAYSQLDYLTMFELTEGNQIDQLTKEQVSSSSVWKSEVMETPSIKRSQTRRASIPILPHSDESEAVDPLNDPATHDYLKKLILLLIRFKFIEALTEYFTNNNVTNDPEASRIIKNLQLMQLNFENSLRLVPDSILTLYNTYSKNKRTQQQQQTTQQSALINLLQSLSGITSEDDDAHFFAHLIQSTALFTSNLELKKEEVNTEEAEDELDKEAEEARNCQELAEFLFEDSQVKPYLSKLGFIKHSRFFTTAIKSSTNDDDVWITQQALQEEALQPNESENGNRMAPDSRDYSSVEFGATQTLFYDRDLVQAFTVDPTDPASIVAATSHGLIEVDLAANQRIVRLAVEKTNSASTAKTDQTTPGSLTPGGAFVGSRSSSTSPVVVPQPHDKNRTALSVSAAPGTQNSSSSASVLQVDQRLISCLQAHPYDPFYLSGGVDGSIVLWQFKVTASLFQYTPSGSPYVNRIRFSDAGTKFAACMSNGKISLWRWGSYESTTRPYLNFECHGERTSDMAFLNQGSFFVTCGSGGSNIGNKDSGVSASNITGSNNNAAGNIAFWDSLLPQSKMKVWSNNIDTGGTALVYSPRHQVVFCGSKKGEISLIDLRQRQVFKVIEKAHDQAIKSLDIDPRGSFLVSGSADGTVKIWSLTSTVLSALAKSPSSSFATEYDHDPSEVEVPIIHKWDDVHKQQTLVRPLSLSQVASSGSGFFSPVRTVGVMQVAICHDALYSCGSDGRVLCKPII